MRSFHHFERSGLLAVRLEELQAVGLLRGYSYARSCLEYRLTRVGVATFPIAIELLRWGDRGLWAGRPPVTACSRRLAELPLPRAHRARDQLPDDLTGLGQLALLGAGQRHIALQVGRDHPGCLQLPRLQLLAH